ncbi:ABC transporter permease [Roseateles depolymerans]|uniref:ABC transporter permease n=1 Tax=Roseateles depolymerans TaxID=76731 RepID=A0A0U3NH09_9BURK|nr:FtsX-like permease family protein [Roseateles depolymerans]ALV07696.1 ABC transporter permease [Roseateles depolymerans]REG22081.1 putative ABC transport system permease protein [Roseateles depolymerans]
MDILPILLTLKRHKTAASLIVLQMALTCAIVCNALFLISQRIDRIGQPSGLDEDRLVMLQVAGVTRTGNEEAQTQTDLQALREVPGVQSVTILNQMAYAPSSTYSGVRLQGEDSAPSLVASTYYAAENAVATMGLRLVAGRDFVAGDFVGTATATEENPVIPSVLINQEMAEQLFPGESPLGKALYVYGNVPHHVVGVVQRLTSPTPGTNLDLGKAALILPVRPSYRGGMFLLRTEPGQREAVLKTAAEKLVHNSPGLKRLVRQQALLTDMRSDYYRQDRSMIQLLAGVCVGLLVVTAFGIIGLGSFWVQQRTRMIGTRRALGATRGQILRYFQTENLLLSTIGIVLGMAGAYGISLLLMRQYEMPPLPALYLPVGAVVLWSLGQVAVLAPARRAAALPPVVALRG